MGMGYLAVFTCTVSLKFLEQIEVVDAECVVFRSQLGLVLRKFKVVHGCEEIPSLQICTGDIKRQGPFLPISQGGTACS